MPKNRAWIAFPCSMEWSHCRHGSAGTPPECGIRFDSNRWCRSFLARPPATGFEASGFFSAFWLGPRFLHRDRRLNCLHDSLLPLSSGLVVFGKALE